MCLCPGCLHGDSECKYVDYVDSWQGFDMMNYKNTEVDLTYWNSVVIRKTVGSREDYAWDDVMAIVCSVRTYNEVNEYVKKNPLPFFDCHIDLTLSERDTDHIDPVALHYMPDDVPGGLVPCRIQGDGNCFPRSLSFICFRNQEMHTEFRMRLLHESVINAKHYISNRYLSRGCNIVYRKGGPVKQLAMYSEQYNPEEELDVVKIYKAEVMQLAKDGNYCGLWQMCQAANVLCRPVVSVYPSQLHEGMRTRFQSEVLLHRQ